MRAFFPAWFYVAAVAVGLAGTVPFVDLDGALVFDPDLRIDDLLVYHAFFSSWSTGVFTPPAPNVYFEGHSLIYGLALHLYQAIAALLGYSPPVRDAALATVSIVGALAHIGATTVFFATARRLTANALAALILTVLFGLSPQILAIDLIRIDRLMILPLVVVMHVSVLITRDEARVGHGVVLGLAMALLTATKISGVLFGVLPALAIVFALIPQPASAWSRIKGVIIAAVSAGLPALTILMIRHVIAWRHFLVNLAQGYDMQMKWTSVLPSTPVLYYNVDLFAGYGPAFLALVALSSLIVGIRAIADHDPTCRWLFSALVMFSVAGMAVFKYDRGGYHLVPLYLYALAVALRMVMDVSAGRLRVRRAWGEAATAGLILLLPVTALANTYLGQADAAGRREASVIETHVKARDWIVARFKPGERVCMMTSSQWANPPLAGTGLQVTTAPLEIPYLDGAAMANYAPPSLAQLRGACDAVVLNDLHNTVYLANFTTRGLDHRRGEWDRLIADLHTYYPPKVFDGRVKAYFVSRVEVFDLRPRTKAAALPSRAEILAGTFGGDAFSFAGLNVPLVSGRYSGAVDGLSAYPDGSIGVEGWAIDAKRMLPAVGIILVADGHIIGFGGTSTVRRPDVVAAFEIPDYQLAGYAVCGSGPAALVRVFALGNDGTAGELTGDAGKGLAPSRVQGPPPIPCRSFAAL